MIVGNHYVVLFMSEILATSALALPVNGMEMLSSKVYVCVFAHVMLGPPVRVVVQVCLL